LTIPRHPGRLNRLVLAVTVSAHASAAVLPDVAALSPGLRTPPLPATHAWVGYGWQNNRLYHFFRYNSYTSSLVSHDALVGPPTPSAGSTSGHPAHSPTSPPLAHPPHAGRKTPSAFVR